MARGRRGDAPGLQQAKGNPGKRVTKVAARIAQAERVAELLASAPGENANDVMAPPAFLNDPASAPALKIWRDYLPELHRTHRMGPLHRLHFAMFCVYMGEWLTACADIQAKGYYQSVKTIAGGAMERTRPVVQWREIAYRNVMEMAREFGLTPREEYALFREQADAVGRNPGLFKDHNLRAPAESALPTLDAEPAPRRAVIGSLDGLDSAPPGAPLN